MQKFLFTGVLVLLGAAAMPLSASPLGGAAHSGKIAFARDGSRAIYVVNPAGSAPTRLRIVSRFRGVSWAEPAWSPDGEKLALLGTFYNGTLDKDHRIYVRSPSGRAKDITEVGSGTGSIAWSPSGKWLAIGTGLDAWRLAVVNVSTGKTRLVTRYYGDDPAWSPDGKWICFLYGVGPFPEGRAELARPRRRTAERTRIQTGSAAVLDPAWSPDGKRISFARYGLGIWVIDAHGSHQRRLTTRAGDGEPAWSPSGSQIVFTRGSGYRSELWIMRRDGSHQARLITNGYSASWQPQH